MQRIEYARRQALDAYERAAECIDNASRDEWLKAAGLWEALARQYELLLNVSEPTVGVEGQEPRAGRPEEEIGGPGTD